MDAQDKKIATDLSYEIIKEVSRAIRPYVGKPESGEKVKIGADGTPTSFIDIVAEEKVINILKNAPVLSYIVSEEIGELKLGKGTKRSISLTQELRRDDIEDEERPKFIFLVDPIDGTSNAIKEIPAFGISIAVASVPEGRLATLNDVELGFISNFGNGNFFEAEKGKGCWLNNEEVHPSNIINFSDITLGGFTKSGTSSASQLVDNARRMRVLGSVVLEISYVASGRYDAFIDLRGSRIIDIAASKLILEEAGGIITDKYGEKLNNKLSIHEKTIVIAANNKILHKQMIDTLNDTAESTRTVRYSLPQKSSTIFSQTEGKSSSKRDLQKSFRPLRNIRSWTKSLQKPKRTILNLLRFWMTSTSRLIILKSRKISSTLNATWQSFLEGTEHF